MVIPMQLNCVRSVPDTIKLRISQSQTFKSGLIIKRLTELNNPTPRLEARRDMKKLQQAFPVGLSCDQHAYSEGMTLRDYFAGQALSGMTVNRATLYQGIDVSRQFAKESYMLADAMLAEREKNP